MVSLSFKNHFVVELLWPLSREESAGDGYGRVLKSTIIFNEFLYWNQVQRRADSRNLNLLSDIADGKTKPWLDAVYRSLVLHDKMLFEEENERSESGAEVSTSFHSVE